MKPELDKKYRQKQFGCWRTLKPAATTLCLAALVASPLTARKDKDLKSLQVGNVDYLLTSLPIALDSTQQVGEY